MQKIRDTFVYQVLFVCSLLMLLNPVSGQSKPSAALTSIIVEGRISSKLKDRTYQQIKSSLSKKYEIISKNRFKSAEVAIETEIGKGVCETDICIRKIQDILKIDHYFSLKLNIIGKDLQTILTHVDRETRSTIDGFCSDCTAKKLSKLVQLLGADMISANPEFSMFTMPLVIPPVFPAPPSVTDILEDLPIFFPQDIDLGIDIFIDSTVFLGGNISIQDALATEESKSDSSIPTEGFISETTGADIEEDILIFSLSSDLVKEEKGEFLFQVSSFTQLKSVKINGIEQLIPADAYQVKLGVDAQYEPGENFFEIEATSESDVREQEFIVFYETKDVKRNAPKVKPFVLIAIFGAADDDNSNSSPEGTEKISSTKTNYVLVPTFNQKITYFSTFSVKGLITADQQLKEDFESREFMLKQIALEWKTRNTPLGDITYGVGANQLSLNDSSKTSSLRDSWTDEYKQAGADTFANLVFNFGADAGTKGNVKLEHKLKTVPDTPTSNGTANSFKIVSKIKMGTFKTDYSLTQTITDIVDDSKDKTTVSGGIKLGLPLKPFMLSLNTKLTQTTNRVADSVTAVKTKTRKTSLTGAVSYPVFSRLILAYSRKFDKQTSNLINSDYQKNSNVFQITLIF